MLFRPKGGLKRAAGRIAAALGLAVVFAASLLGGALLHLDTRPVRRVVRNVATRGLATFFRGQIIVGEIDSVSLREVRIRDARVLDPRGREIISAHGIVARISAARLLSSIWSNEGAVEVRLPRVQIEQGIVTLIEGDDSVVPSIADAFLLRDSGPATAGAKPRPVSVQLPRIELGHVKVNGNVARPLDADINHLVGSVAVENDIVSVDVEPTGIIERTYLPTVADGIASYHLRVDTIPARVARATVTDADGVLRPAEATTMWMDFSGSLGAIATTARCEITGNHLSGSAFLPRISPEGARAIIPQLPLAREVSATVKVDGDFPDLAVESTIELPQGGGLGVVSAQGQLTTEAAPKLELSFETSELDPRDFIATLPEARVNARGRVVAKLDVEDPRVSLEIATLAATADGTVIPAIDMVLDLVRGDLLGTATIHEPGIPIDARFVIESTGKILFGVAATSDGIEQAPRLGGIAAGTGSAEVKGEFAGGHLKAVVKARGAGLRVASVSAGRGSVSGTLDGPLADLQLVVDASLDNVLAQGQPFDKVVLHARGPVLSPQVALHIDDAELGKISADGHLAIASRSATGVSFKVERKGVVAKGKAARIGVGSDGALAAEGVSVSGEGLGMIAGSLVVDGGDLRGKLRGDAVDLDKLSKLVGSPLPFAGVANVDIDIERAGSGRKGHIEVELEDGELFSVGAISARLSVKFDGPTVETSGYVRLLSTATDAEREAAAKEGLLAQAQLCDGTIAEVRIANGKGTLEGPLLSTDTWKRFVGDADVAAENWNLRCLTKRVPFGLPVSEAGGLLTTRLHVARREGDPYPSLEDVYVRTHGLELVGARSLLGGGEPWESRLIDGQLRGSLDGRTGRADTHLTLFDGTILGEITGGITFDLAKLVASSSKPSDLKSPSTIALLRASPFDASIAFPRRSIAELRTLPAPLRDQIPALSGDIRVDAEVHGTVDAPFAYVTAQGFRIAPKSSMGVAESWAPPLDIELTGTYEADDGKAAAEAHIVHEGTTVAIINAGIDVTADALTHPSDAPLPWTGGMYMSLFELPLGAIPALSDRDIAGPVTGTISMSGLNANPKLDVNLTAPFVRLGELYFDGRVIAHIAPRPSASDEGAADAATTADEHGQADAAKTADERGQADATFEVDLDGQDGGGLQVLAYAGIRWAGLVIPELDRERGGGLAMSAKELRLGAAFPLVAGDLSKLDGIVDGAAQLKWGRVGDVDQGHIEGQLKVRDGVVFIPQFGQELRGGKATIIANPAGILRIENIEAGGISGRVHGALLARFDGLLFRGATGDIAIDEGHEIPITFEGVPVGSASGQVQYDATYDAGELSVHARVPIVRLALPGSSSRNVQDLGDDATIELSDPLGPPKQPRPKDALRYSLTVDIERADISGSGLDARVKSAKEAPIRVRLAEDVKVSGDLLFDRGSVVLRQKKFEVDTGLVRLREEQAGNPYVNLTAHWEGPDGGRVYVDYIGNLQPITDDKIRFRSDPPRTKQDIIATLLFGTDLSSTPTGGTPTAGDKSVTGLATDVGGSVASQALNSLLSSRYVTLTVDRATDGGLRGKVEWRATDGLTFGFTGAQVNNQAAVPTAPTSSASGTGQGGAQGEVSLDWHFLRNWSLRSTVGAGVGAAREPSTGIDVLWQYRY